MWGAYKNETHHQHYAELAEFPTNVPHEKARRPSTPRVL
jgi:hypothetical protein